MNSTVFFRLLPFDDKAAALSEAVDAARGDTGENASVYVMAPESFRQVPGTPFAYWVSERIRRLFKELPLFEGEGRTVRVGLQTSDDFRFVRAWWEVPPEKILDAANGPDWREDLPAFQEWCRRRTFEGKRWVPFAKGGKYSPYYADIHLVVNWERDGEEIRNFKDPKTGKLLSRPQNTDYYFRPGLTWSVRAKAFNPWPLPAGCIFSHRAYTAFVENGELLRTFGMFNSKIWDYLFRLSLGRFGHPEYLVGIAQRLPWSMPAKSLDDTSRKTIRAAMYRYTRNERTLLFNPQEKFSIDKVVLRQDNSSIDALANDLYRLDQSAMDEIDRFYIERFGENYDSIEGEYEDANNGIGDNHGKERMLNQVSFLFGSMLGRWDIRVILNSCVSRELADPFEPLPICSPATLIGSDGHPATPGNIVSEECLRARSDASRLPPEGSVKQPTIPDSDYPIEVKWDGILVDDPDHPDDIIRRLRDMMAALWKERADAIEREACEILGVKELRDCFRKPGNGGFWMDHVKRYSKSRRKAPIYWLLQSSRKNYAIWLYYHRLDKDILFKVLVEYIQPKLRLEEDRFKQLRDRRKEVGLSGREAKQLEKELDQEEAFLSELQDFHDKLKRAADLNLEPDLNDGVILNIAPLRELVPWKEAKKYWDELMAGKYEWSSIGKQLRERGMVS